MSQGEKVASSTSSSVRARGKWRKLLAVIAVVNSGSFRFSSPASAANGSIPSDEDEVAMVHVDQARISTEESIFEIQLVVTSTGTSPETQYYSCTDAEQDDDGKGNYRVPWRRNSSNRGISMETNNVSPMSVQQSSGGNEHCEQFCGRDISKQKVLEWIFAIANLIVESLSIALDQLSSQRKHVFLPVCLGISISAVLICLCEFGCKIWKEKAIWEKRGVFPWFYYPSGVHVGSFAEVIGLACASGQCIITIINYALFLKHGHVTIKVSIWATIFAVGQLCSKVRGEFKQNVHKRESSPTDLKSLV